MKLNYRDRIVLTVVIVVLVWVAGVMLFIKPAIEGLQDSQTALDDAKATRADLEARVEEDKDLPQRIDAAYKEVTKMTESFYSIQENQVASQQVDDLLDAEGSEDKPLINLDMHVSDYTIYKLNPYAYINNKPMSQIDMDVEEYKNQVDPLTAEAAMSADGEASANTSGDKIVPAPATIGSYSMTFSFKGALDDVESFCEKLQTSNDQKTMVVNALSYKFVYVESKEKVEEGEKPKQELSDTDVEGTMELTMMVVEKLPDPNTLA